MAKRIVFVATDYGVDGMGKKSKVYASFDEDELKKLLSRDPSRAWRTQEEEIIDVDKARTQALSKLNGVDRLVLGLPDWIDERYPKKK